MVCVRSPARSRAVGSEGHGLLAGTDLAIAFITGEEESLVTANGAAGRAAELIEEVARGTGAAAREEVGQGIEGAVSDGTHRACRAASWSRSW